MIERDFFVFWAVLEELRTQKRFPDNSLYDRCLSEANGRLPYKGQ